MADVPPTAKARERRLSALSAATCPVWMRTSLKLWPNRDSIRARVLSSSLRPPVGRATPRSASCCTASDKRSSPLRCSRS